MSATADQELAELRRANAELRDALAQRNSEYGERLKQQSATIDVLKAMSASPGDPQPVFDLIVDRARDLCDAYGATVYEFDGKLIHYRAATGVSEDATVRAQVAGVYPIPPTRYSGPGRAILDRRIIRIDDMELDAGLHPILRHQTAKSAVFLPLLRGDVALGALALGSRERGGFADAQIQLLQTFAEQAVIAITSAGTYRALQARTADLQESLEYQTATSDVLKVISRSTFDLHPVLATVIETAARLCNADMAMMFHRDEVGFRMAVNYGYPPELEGYWREKGSFPIDLKTPAAGHRAARERRPVHVHDVTAVPDYPKELHQLGGQRTSLSVPLLRDGEPIGVIGLGRRRVDPFTDRQIELICTFADQAVIAIENTRLVTEQREALKQQTATAEVLRVINASPGDLTPVFDAILEKAHQLCGVTIGALEIWDGEHVRALATRGMPPDFDRMLREGYRPPADHSHWALVNGDRFVHVPNPGPVRDPTRSFAGAGTFLAVALRKDKTLLGRIVAVREEIRPFSDKEMALLEGFGAQAVIAMENARLLAEIHQRREELRITFENMGDGVALFDDTQHIVAWNSKFQEIFDLPDGLLEQHGTYEEHLRFLAARGDLGAGIDTAEQIAELVASTGQPYGYERTRPNGRVVEIRRNPVPDGGFVLIFSDITERKRSEAEIRAARDAAEAAYRDLKAAQASLIQAEKMASLGQLTAGIAHEIKNPLNFVNNFASLSVDLLDELKQTVAPGLTVLDEARRAEVDDIASTLASNLDKINEHGRRADGIVRGMLEHSRGSSGDRRQVELNALVDEALNLAYHGARAQDQSFAVTLQRDLGEDIAPITLAPQDVTRVLLNLFSNGFYAARERQRTQTMPDIEPTVKVSTRDLNGAVEIRVRDNGIGIPDEIKDRLFQPFFTTKPPGEGTGLGLSMSYDIITQQHGGSISVESKVGKYSEFTVLLPRTS